MAKNIHAESDDCPACEGRAGRYVTPGAWSTPAERGAASWVRCEPCRGTGRRRS